jgi:hypothetical protein
MVHAVSQMPVAALFLRTSGFVNWFTEGFPATKYKG